MPEALPNLQSVVDASGASAIFDQRRPPTVDAPPIILDYSLALRGGGSGNARLVRPAKPGRTPELLVIAAGAVDTLNVALGSTDPLDQTIPSSGWTAVATNHEALIVDERAVWGYYTSTDNRAELHVETSA